MPHTIEQLGVTTVGIALAMLAFWLVQRRWPNDDPTDTLVVLWRRWAARGRLGLSERETAPTAERPASKPGVKKKPSEKPKRKPSASKPEATVPKRKAMAPKAAKPKPKAAKPRPATAKRPPAKTARASKATRPASGRPAKTTKKAQAVPEREPVDDLDATATEPSAEPPAHDTAETVLNRPPEEPEMSPEDRDESKTPDEEPRRRRFLRRRREVEDAAPEADVAPPVVPAEQEPVAGGVEESATVAEQEPEAAEPELPELPSEPEPEPERQRARPAAFEHGDHVPLDTTRATERSGEPKILLRQRFRRGLRRTRERLGAEMREAFTGGATPEAFDKLEDALVAADVGVATTAVLVDELREAIGLSDKTLSRTLRDVMVKQLSDADRRLRLMRGKVSVWVVVGVNGTGKTTTIAKLAARARDLGLPVSLAAADTFRAAAVEQLSEWGRRLGIEVIKQGQGADPGAVVFDALAHAKANGKRLLIVDTAGRLHTRKPLMDELQKVFRVIERDEGAVIAETLLVIDATTGQNGIAQAKAFRDAVNVTGLALAKLDGSAKGGITFAVERELGVPVKAVGIGESEKDLVPFDPESFVEALVGEDET